MTEKTLREGKIATMSELQASFENISGANNVSMIRQPKGTEQLLQNEILGIEFHRAKRVNESERVSIKRTKDIAIQLVCCSRFLLMDVM